MSDQEPGHGYHALTLSAVHKLFSDLPPDSKLMGLSEKDFFAILDHWQAYADRNPLGAVGAPPIGYNLVTGETLHVHVPGHEAEIFGLGNTYFPSWLLPGAQAAHAVADPYHDAQWNLDAIRHSVVNNLVAAKEAHTKGDQEGEWRHLGVAVHCLEDSYSSGHMFRDPTNPTDPTAAIQGINNFSIPGDPWDTHNSSFDSVPVTDGRLERGSDQASVPAVTSILQTYIHQRDAPSSQDARSHFAAAVAPFLSGPEAHVFTHPHDPMYQQELTQHYNTEVCRDWPSVSHSDAVSVDPRIEHHGATGVMSGDSGGGGPQSSGSTKSVDHSIEQHGAAGVMSGDSGGGGPQFSGSTMSVDPGARHHDGASMSVDPSAHHDGAVITDSSTGHHDGAVVNPDPSAGHHDGAVVSPDPSAGHHDGAVVNPDPNTGHHDGAVVNPDPSAGHHDGTVVSHDSSTGHHDGVVVGTDPGAAHEAAAGAEHAAANAAAAAAAAEHHDPAGMM